MSARADIQAGRATVSLHIRQDAFTRGLQQARQRLNSFGTDLMSIGSRMAGMGAAMVAPFALATRTFADFDDQMRLVGAVAGASATQLASMTAVAEELGRTTSYTAAQVAALMAELGRGGFNPDQINAMTGAVLNLARATGTDAATSAAIVTATVNQFGMAAGDAARVADVLTKAANATNSSVESLGESLQYAGPVAKDLGMSLEETVAILGTLGNAGIQGSEAGTALRRLGVIAASEGEKLKEVFNVSNVDAGGKLKPLVQLLGEIGEATAGLDVADRTAKFNEAFGLLGITAASVISRTSAATQQLTTQLVDAEGAAAKAAAEMDSGIGGAFRIIRSVAEGLDIAIGRVLADAIKGVTKTASEFLGVATEWIGKNQGVVASFVVMGSAIAAVGVALVGLGVTMKATAAAAMAIGPLFKAAGLAAAAAWGTVRLAFTLLTLKSQIATALITTSWQVASRAIIVAWKVATTAISAAIGTLTVIASAALIATVWAATAFAISVAFIGLGATLEAVAAAVTSVWAVAGGTITAAWVTSAGVIGSIWTLVSGQIATLAAVATAAWITGGGVIGVSIAVLGALFGMLGIQGTASAGMVGTAWAVGGTLASAAWSLFTGVLSAALAPAVLLTIAAFAVKVAWIAAWSVISGPILPFIAIMGVAVAVVGLFAAQAGLASVKATSFRSTLSAVQGTLGSLMVAAQKTGNVLLGALKVGDYETAWRGAMAGVKLAIAEALIGGQKIFASFFNSVMWMLKRFALEFAINMALLFEAAMKPWKRDEMSRVLQERLSNFNIAAGMTFDTDKMKTDAEKELERLQKLLNDRAAQAAADEITGKAKEDEANKKKAEVDALQAQGKLTPEEAAVEKLKIEKELAAAKAASAAATGEGADASDDAADAHDRETQKIREQITALKEGEDAAERMRLKKEGLNDSQIEGIMKLRVEEKALEADRDKAQMRADAIAKVGDAMVEAGKSPADVLIEEQRQIEEQRKKGLIDDQTAKKAMQDAELRAMQRDLDKGVEDQRKKLGLDTKPDMASDAQRPALASVATTSAAALMAQSRGGGSESPMVAAINRAQERQEKIAARAEAKQIENHREQVQALRAIGLWHS
jgi:TP901 family phage tail tape measure protein